MKKELVQTKHSQMFGLLLSLKYLISKIIQPNLNFWGGSSHVAQNFKHDSSLK